MTRTGRPKIGTPMFVAPDGRRFRAHGTASAYNKGCRCKPCTEAHRVRHAKLQAELRARPRSDVLHGTVTGYFNWSCRCWQCSAAGSAQNRRVRLARIRRQGGAGP